MSKQGLTGVAREPMVNVEPPLGGSNRGGHRVTIMSYNILSDASAKPNFFTKVKDTACLRWENRKKAILAQIQYLDPDIVCLQEVDHYKDFFLPELSKLGYNGHFKKRTGDKPDGCATFFKRSKYSLCQALDLEFDTMAVTSPGQTSSSRNHANNWTGSVASVLALQAIDDDSIHVISNCHLYWNPNASELRLQHVTFLKEQLVAMAGLYEDQVSGVFACGDFNDSEDSATVQFMLQGDTAMMPEHFRSFNHAYSSLTSSGAQSTSTPPNKQRANAKGNTANPAQLQGIPTYCSIWTPQIKNNIDYIFFSNNYAYKPTSILPLPTSMTMLSSVGQSLPTWQDPSDHLPLYAEFHKQSS